MISRGQSDVVGIALLTAIVAITVTGSGAVVLTEVQSNVEDEPLADIESTLTEETVVLEHTGGNALNASDVFVQLSSRDEPLPLTEFDSVDDEFVGGMTIRRADLDNMVGDVIVRVIHEPSQTVLHEEKHYLGFRFLIGGEPGPVFMTDSTPVNYTAPGNAEITVSDESVVEVDESETNISALTPSGSTAITADDRTDEKTIDLTVIEPDQLGIDTLDVRATEGTLEADGELTALGELDETDLFVRYRIQRPVEFTGEPDDNGDNVIAHGGYHTDPDGYAHNDEWVHDNSPLLPGLSKTYEYTVGTDVNVAATLRDEAETTDTTNPIDNLAGLNTLDIIADSPPQGSTFEITVEYTADGSTVNVYYDGSRTQQWDVSGSDEVYFSSFEGGGTSGPNSLRVTSVPGPGEPQYDRIEAGVESPTTYTGELSGLQPDTYYYVEAHAERDITNAVINATGETLVNKTKGLVETQAEMDITAESVRLRGELLRSAGDTDVSFVVTEPDGTVVTKKSVATGLDTPQAFETTVGELSADTEYEYYARANESGGDGDPVVDTGKNVSFRTDEPVVTTDDTRRTGATTLEVDGELVDLGGLDEIGLYVQYRKQEPIEFDGTPDDNGDNVISHGNFYNSPDGYAHGNEWVHDNDPLIPGVSKTYEYTVGTDVNVAATLRDSEETDTTSFDNLDGLGTLDIIADSPPQGSPFEITVEYTADGSAINVYYDGSRTERWDVSEYDEVYFSSFEGGGTSGSDSLRLITVPGPGDQQSQVVELGVDDPKTFTGELSDIRPDTNYYVEAHAEQLVNGTLVNASGETLANRTGELVETQQPTDITAESATLNGNLTGSAGDTNVSFVLTESDGTVITETEVATGLDTSQAFETTVGGLSSDTEYVYYARATESGVAGDPVIDTGENVSFRTDEPVVTTVDTRSTGSTTLEVDGRIDDLGGLDEMDLYVQYRKQEPITFDGTPNDNGDNVISHGNFYNSPDGYAHGNEWVHDNSPLVPGLSKTYEYTVGTDVNVAATLRDSEETTDTTNPIDNLDGLGTLDVIANSPPQGSTFEITVEYTADGSTVNVYYDGSRTERWDVSGYDEVYFSSFEGGGTSGSKSLRLITVPGPGDRQSTLVESGVADSTLRTGELTGLQSDTNYYLEAHAGAAINGTTINATGQRLIESTDP